MVHIRLPEAMHKKVRIRAAETDQTIQDWVFEAIRRELERQGRESEKVSQGEDQICQLKRIPAAGM